MELEAPRPESAKPEVRLRRHALAAAADLAAVAQVGCIDDAVAVVIDAVADFRLWLHTALTDQRAADARDDAGLAGADVVPAGLTDGGDTVVDDTVAIVVDAVADFRARTDGAFARGGRRRCTRCVPAGTGWCRRR